MNADDWSDDAVLGGQLTLRQRKRGHRAGTDAVLLASVIPETAEGLAFDAGAASGAAGLMLAIRAPRLHVTLVEIDPDECALARHNIAANALTPRCAILQADLLAPEAEREAAGLRRSSANFIITNPPFLSGDAARVSPDPARARAHTLPAGGLERWCRTLAWLAAPDGMLALIHRADHLEDVLHALKGRFGAVALRPILPYADRPASRILITARKASHAPLTILPPFTLHEGGGEFTKYAAAIHAGASLK